MEEPEEEDPLQELPNVPKMIQKLGDQIHKKLIQYLHNRSAPSISDPVCRFLIHMFQNSP